MTKRDKRLFWFLFVLTLLLNKAIGVPDLVIAMTGVLLIGGYIEIFTK